MKMTSLKIELKQYGPDKGMYLGSIEFVDGENKIALALDSEACDKYFDVTAMALEDTARVAAQTLRESIQEYRRERETIIVDGSAKDKANG